MNPTNEERLVSQYGGLVAHALSVLNIPKYILEDCESCGKLGLVTGIKTLHKNDSKKCTTKTWLYNNIKWAIWKYLQEESKHQHARLVEIQSKRKNSVYEYLPELDEVEKKIISMRLKNMSFKQISTKLGLGPYYVYRKYQGVIAKAKNANK